MKATDTWGSPVRNGDRGRGSKIILSGNELNGKFLSFI